MITSFYSSYLPLYGAVRVELLPNFLLFFYFFAQFVFALIILLWRSQVLEPLYLSGNFAVCA